MARLQALSHELKQYLIITGNYWCFTLTDGALRMLVVLYFHQLGYKPLAIAMLFLFYEIFGVITNLVGGWLGARIGLNKTMNIGLILQVIALSMLLVPASYLTVVWVMAAQALSGIAKDLNKMSAKSAIKTLIPSDQNSQLFRWVAILTGSKNTLKGVGFFLGGALLAWLGFRHAILVMAVALLLVWIFSLITLKADLGKAANKPKFKQLFSKNQSINTLSLARLFLFGARDVWFVVALPVYFSSTLDWSHQQIGTFFASWVIGYGFVQAYTPKLLGYKQSDSRQERPAFIWNIALAAIAVAITVLFSMELHIQTVLVAGLLVFGAIFAVNSAIHSYLIVEYANSDSVSMDVGFYYMANAMGRLVGTVLSGWLFQQWGLLSCLIASSAFLILSSVVVKQLEKPN